MKKVNFFLIVVLFVLSSCSAIHWQIGETTESFMQRNHKHQFDMVKSSAEWTVYKWTNNWSYTDPPYFFYFHYGTLYQVDRGVKAADIVIENR